MGVEIGWTLVLSCPNSGVDSTGSVKFSETRQPLASCFTILKAPTVSSWSRMCSGHCFSVPRSSVKGAGEGSSLWNPSTYTPLVRPRHVAMPVYKRWLKNVTLRYAGDRVCSWNPGDLETTSTDTGVSYWQQSLLKADRALFCPCHAQWNHYLDQWLMYSQASQYLCLSVEYHAMLIITNIESYGTLCSKNTFMEFQYTKCLNTYFFTEIRGGKSGAPPTIPFSELWSFALGP